MSTLTRRNQTAPRLSRETLAELLEEADVHIDGERPWDMQVHDQRLFDRILAEGNLGLGEAYMEGWWDVDQLDQFFHRVLQARLNGRIRDPKLIGAWLKARLFNLQSPRRSRRVAEMHYDLGNTFYQHMLDPWMQYTCAYWKEADTLAQAQEAKLDLVCRKLHLNSGDHVLELGGGWGGFARFAAERYGCRVTSYNISREQVAYARESCRDLPVDIRHEDYRRAEGRYDKVASIGMMEHVGASNYGTFMDICRRCLKPGGLMMLHTIGCNRTKRVSDPWFTKYIFPGGQLPSPQQSMHAAEKRFVVEDLHNIGADYDPTLMAWFDNFHRNWPRFEKELGETFYRMWRYYLLSCAGSFRARNVQLWQIVLSPDGINGGYAPVR